ncbi:MAG: hypothetical protein FWD36_00515 [Treponema sp.]|nr:hypothetical protein [Treponema sp.]
MKRTALLFVLFLVVLAGAWAQVVKVVQNSNDGWELLVDGKQMFVKGVVFAVNPPGTSFTYNLWNEGDTTIRRVLDYEGELMRAAGINAIRTGPDIPRRWVEYLYNNFDILTLVNYDLERWSGIYGHTANYYDPEVRQNVMKKAYNMVNRYKDASGILGYLFGDGNPEGLYYEGSGKYHDNDPDVARKYGSNPGLRKARALFSLTEDVFQQTKDLDPDRPVGFLTNGLSSIDLIADECPSLDFIACTLGQFYDWAAMRTNPDFWREARQKLNKPVIIGSFGAPAWNAKHMREDQYNQALWIVNQWKDMYGNAYGKGQSNNIGGFVSEWTDQWYKNDYGSAGGAQIHIHNTEPTGEVPDYTFSHTPRHANMTPEWMGITSQGERKYVAWFREKIPRASYYTLQHIWSADPWRLADSADEGAATIDSHFAKLDYAYALARGRDAVEKPPNWRVTNEVNVLAMQTGDDVQKTMKEDGENFFTAFKDTQYGVKLSTTFWGQTELGTISGGKLEGGATVYMRHDMVTGEGPVRSDIYRTQEMGLAERPFDVYQGWFTWKGFGAEINAHYHHGKGSWLGEGDFFNLNTEKYDLYSDDIWNVKSPIAVEGRYNFGMQGRQGLAVIMGPKIYAGAPPMILGKWYKEGEWVKGHYMAYSVMVGQSFSHLNEEKGEYEDLGVYEKPNTTGSLWFSWTPTRSAATPPIGWVAAPFFQVQVGIMGTNFQKIGEGYFLRNTDVNYYPGLDKDGYLLKEGEITALDTLATKLRVEYRTGRILGFQTEIIHAGLVANSNWVPPLMSTIFADIGTGNRFEIKGGVNGTYRNYGAALNGLYRKPLQGPVTSKYIGAGAIHSINRPVEPFAVGGNREMLSLEAIFSFDLEPASWLWEWNVWDTEGALFATRVRGRYNIFEGLSDPGTRKGADGKFRSDYSGYPETYGNYELGWMVFWNPKNDIRVANSLDFTRGFAWNGIPDSADAEREVITGWQESLRFRYKRVVFSGLVAFDLWGPVSSDRENNQTYPMRWGFDLAWGLTHRPSLMDSSNRVGIRWNGVIRDRFSPNASQGRDSQELILYFNYTF